MKSQNMNLSYFTGTIFVVAILAILIFLPFLTVLAMAGIMAVVLGPLYREFLHFTKNRKNISAFVTIVIFVVVIIFPLMFVVQRIFIETYNLNLAISNNDAKSVEVMNGVIESYGRHFFPEFTFDVREQLSSILNYIIGNLGNFFSVTLNFILKACLALFALFYFLKDGDKFKQHLVEISPLPERGDERVVHSLKSAINSIVLGSVVVAIVQGVVTGIGFTIFGVPNPVLWATVAAVASLIPGIGTNIVWALAVIYLFFFGGNFQFAWVAQLLWGVAGVTLIDSTLGPKIIERGSNIHSVLILFSILGGIIFFGPEGFLLGPLVLTVLFTLIKIYQEYAKERA